MGVTTLVNINFDLLLVGVAVAGIILLGCIIFFNDPKSATNRAFLYFSIITAVWGVSNYLEYRFTTIEATLAALRIHLFLSTLHAFSFFQLAYVFPKEKLIYPKWYKRFLIPLAVGIALLTLTPAVFTGLEALAPVGEVTRATPGPAILFFMLFAFGSLFSGLGVLLVRTINAYGIERRQEGTLLIGMFLTAILILVFNVVLPNIFSNVSFIPLAALFMLPFIALTSYAIYKHHLFNLKVAATAFLGFMVTVFSFVNVVYSMSFSAVTINIAAFIIILLGSIKIVQDTLNLQKANEKLEELDRIKSEFLSIASHQLRAPITAIRGYTSLILQKDYGEIPEKLEEPLSRISESARNMASSIEDYLNISRIEQGRMKYEKSNFDLSDLVKKAAEEMRPVAVRRGLELLTEPASPLFVMADVGKIKQVISNLIDNAIKYTEKGNVKVAVTGGQSAVGGKQVARVQISDTGMGISRDEIESLFEKFTRARDANKVNTTGTGLGLYVAKQLVEAHGGKIWAESDGPGKGSRFIVELPI